MNNIQDILEVNQLVKNYKEMCKLLNENVKTGQSKQIQLSNWERYFTWNKNGNSFVISELYDEPLPKPKDQRKIGNNNVYAKYIEVLLIDLLSHEENYTLLCSRNWLMASLGIVNFKYTNNRQRDIVKNTSEFKEEELNEWFRRAWGKTDQILFSALNNLKRRCLLDYSKEYEITEFDSPNEENECSHLADDSEKQKFLIVKRKTLDIMTEKHKSDKYPKIFDSMKDLYPNHYNEYYDTLSDVMWDSYGWLAVHTKYKLIYDQENLIQALSTTKTQLKVKLNEKVIDAMHNDANAKVNNSLQKFQEEYALLCETWINPLEEQCVSHRFIKADNYVEVQDKISEIFIRLPDNQQNEKLSIINVYK